MQTFVALLRGINVGGHKKLPMAELRDLSESLGFLNPKTYIQSGNLIFDSDQKENQIESLLAAAIEQKFGFSADVMIRTSKEIHTAAAQYPFDTSNHKLAHIMFLDKEPDRDGLAEVLISDFSPDKLEIKNRSIHFFQPGGILDSNIDFKKLERKLKVSGTARNWRTIQKLVEMTS